MPDDPLRPPEAVLGFWFGDAASDPARAAAREGLWFGSSAEADALVRERFVGAIAAAASGELATWADAPRSALALVVLLDQFPRHVWRRTARAFAHDPQALATAERAVAAGHWSQLEPVEQAFLILPYQHSESLAHQRESVRLSHAIIDAAPPAWRPLLERYHDFAERHRALIERFGRFPHRNRVLGRDPTADEAAYLGAGGESFGQGGTT